MWLLNDDFKMFFGLIIGLASLTQLNAIFQTLTYRKEVEIEVASLDDDFAKLAEKINGIEDTRTRASTIHSMGGASTVHTSMVMSNTSMVSIPNSSMVSPTNTSMVSPNGNFNFSSVSVSGIDEENINLEESAIGDDHFQMNKVQ